MLTLSHLVKTHTWSSPFLSQPKSLLYNVYHDPLEFTIPPVALYWGIDWRKWNCHDSYRRWLPFLFRWCSAVVVTGLLAATDPFFPLFCLLVSHVFSLG